MTSHPNPSKPGDTFDVVVVGAGFAGLYMLYRLRQQGFSCRVFEQGSGVGGTWFWNRYPGARCDVESMEYSYSFSEELQQEWDWSERFAAQPEILRYANHVAERFGLKADIQFNTAVASTAFDDASKRWTVTLADKTQVTCTYVVMATGSLSNARIPDIKGLKSFKGQTFHTGNWPHQDVDLSGQRVAVIGTGSSGIQLIPTIAPQVKHLTVFQRTPNFSMPARNRDLSADYKDNWKRNYAERRAQSRNTSRGIAFEVPTKTVLEEDETVRAERYEGHWQTGGSLILSSYKDIFLNKASNETVAAFVRDKIASIVKDPDRAKLLQPTSFPIGTKRLCLDTNYYETFNRDNVTLVDIQQSPIDAISETGVVVAGKDYPADCLIFATGFDAMTGSLAKIDIRGRNGQSLQEQWAAGPKTYLGLMVADFPNLFLVTGPGSPSVLSNMIVSIEQHVDWIADCLAMLRSKGLSIIEAMPKAQEDWVAHVNEKAFKTLYPQANSWYMGANIPGKPRVFMPYVGGVKAYRQKCDAVVADGYRGFQMAK